MKKTTQRHSDRWYGSVFSDTDDPIPPHGGAPAPEEPYGSPEPPIDTGISRPFAFGA